MAHQPRIRHHGSTSSHIMLPFQFLLGLLFMTSGSILLLKRMGNDYLPFIPDGVFLYVCAIGSVLGGFYLIMTKIWRPRIYI